MTNADDLDVIECAVSKARGILFVVAELNKVEHREVVSRELEGFAMWCMADLLDDASAAIARLQQVEALTEK